MFRAQDVQNEIDQLEAMEIQRERLKGSPKTLTSARGAGRKRPLRTARAILVDMEPRVIDHCLQKKKKWKYDPSRAFKMEGGSGNNWAQGFLKHGENVRDSVLDLFRKEVESCDFLDSFLILESVAGGTGSGLGTYLTGELKDEYPQVCRINCLVWPHSSGEVIVQSYNTVFTMANLQEYSNALLCLSNDYAHSVCSRQEKIERPEMDDLNRVFTRDIYGGLLAPAIDSSPLQVNRAAGAVKFLCQHPSYKCLGVESAPRISQNAISFASNSWPALLKQISPNKSKREFGGVQLAQVLTLAGRDAQEYVQSPQRQVDYSSPYASTLLRFQNPMTAPLFGFDRTVSMVENSARVVAPLDVAVEKAHGMLESNAYVHQVSFFIAGQDPASQTNFFQKIVHRPWNVKGRHS